jgi:tetratricopeptide (TPR) repeat protein
MREWLLALCYCLTPLSAYAQNKPAAVPPNPGQGVDSLLFPREPPLQVDEGRLRALMQLPKTHVSFAFLIDGRSSLEISVPADIGQRIRMLNEQMHANPTDAERYLELSYLYAKTKAERRAEKAKLKAVELFQKRLQAEPGNGRLHGLLAEALPVERQSEALTEALKAVELAPKDAQSWRILGDARLNEMPAVLWRSLKEPRPRGAYSWGDLFNRLSRKKPSGDDIAQVEECLRQAGLCFDRAVSLAPEMPGVRRQRVVWHMMDIFWRQYRGKVDGLQLFREMEPSEDLGELIRLAPDDPEPIAFRAFANITLALAASPRDMSTSASMLPRVSLTPAQARICAAAEASLERLAANPNPVIGESASRHLAKLAICLGKLDLARRCAKRALELDSCHEDTWDVLDVCACVEDETISTLLKSFSFADPRAVGLACVSSLPKSKTAALLMERLTQHPCAATHYRLVRSLDKFGSAADMERELRAAAAKYPDDLHCQLAMTCLLLKNNAASQAEKYLSRVASLREKCDEQDLWRCCVFTQAVYLSLTGHASMGRSWLRRLLDEDPHDKKTEDALNAFRYVDLTLPSFRPPSMPDGSR